MTLLLLMRTAIAKTRVMLMSFIGLDRESYPRPCKKIRRSRGENGEFPNEFLGTNFGVLRP
jgi:hypothetical protein